MAFIVKAGAAAGSVTFKEADKTSTGNSQLASFNPMSRQAFMANLRLAPQGASESILLDGVIADFSEGYSNAPDENDIKKLGTVGERVSWKTADSVLVIGRRFTASDNDTLHLQLGLLKVQNYQWEIVSENMDFPGRTAFLLDKYSNSYTALNLAGSTLVNFSVQNIPGSYAADRFKIIFKQAGVVPVTITSISASRNHDKTASVQWKTVNELNIQKYELERSGDGRDFVAIKSALPQNNAGGRVVYNVVDADNQPGTIFTGSKHPVWEARFSTAAS